MTSRTFTVALYQRQQRAASGLVRAGDAEDVLADEGEDEVVGDRELGRVGSGPQGCPAPAAIPLERGNCRRLSRRRWDILGQKPGNDEEQDDHHDGQHPPEQNAGLACQRHPFRPASLRELFLGVQGRDGPVCRENLRRDQIEIVAGRLGAPVPVIEKGIRRGFEVYPPHRIEKLARLPRVSDELRSWK